MNCTSLLRLEYLYPGELFKVTVLLLLMRFSIRSVVTLVGVHHQCQNHDQQDMTGEDCLLTLVMMFE